MNKIIFFDTKVYEKGFLESSLSPDFELVFNSESLMPTSDISSEIVNAEIISVFTSSRLTAEVLSKFANLKLIATRSVGFSHIDVEYCKANGIKVVNTPHYGDHTIAEYSFGLLLSLVRKIYHAEQDMKNGIVNNQYFGMELFNKKIGIIGLGSIGSKAMKIAKGFSMEVLAFDPYPNKQLQEQYGFEYVDIDHLCKNADIISLYAPATPQNYHLLNEDRLNSMKDGVVIVNTARGELIDTEALFKSIIDKKVAGAALDVLECEEALANNCVYIKDHSCSDATCLRKTLINHKLLALPNVIVTPHSAYDTREAVDRIIEITVDNIVNFNSGQSVTNSVC